ncbi:MAG TPA: hypothetical protein VFV66_11160 [Nonomuraea sp.]|nr:hypothetical protein [Nonomuraea sp.]
MSSGSDELKVPSQRTDDDTADERVHGGADEHPETARERSWDTDRDSPDRSADEEPRGDAVHDGTPQDSTPHDRAHHDGAHHDRAHHDGTRQDTGQHDIAAHDEEAQYEAAREAEARGSDVGPVGTGGPSRPDGPSGQSATPVAAVPGAVVTPAPGDQGAPDAPYRDPYARTGGDMLAEPEPDPAHSTGTAGERAEGTPAHAVPGDVVLFDQDPAQVQDRWREVQASFVDDPGEAVQRADTLVGEVVESLTSSLTTRTNALRDRWKDTGTPDTEQLRLALRDYRNVLDRLLALSGRQSQGTR